MSDGAAGSFGSLRVFDWLGSGSDPVAAEVQSVPPEWKRVSDRNWHGARRLVPGAVRFELMS